jgi:hypothetical protein
MTLHIMRQDFDRSFFFHGLGIYRYVALSIESLMFPVYGGVRGFEFHW